MIIRVLTSIDWLYAIIIHMLCLYKGIGMGFSEGINVWWRERCPILALLPSEAQRIVDATDTALRSDGVGEKEVWARRMMEVMEMNVTS